METYALTYRNQTWLYSVYRSAAGRHILVVIVPGVAWDEIACVLDEAEVAILERDKQAFTELANAFLHNRDEPETKRRRIERRIVTLDADTIALSDAN